jgi:hypothetical protein
MAGGGSPRTIAVGEDTPMSNRGCGLGPGKASYPSGGVRFPGSPLTQRKRPTVDVGRQAKRGFLSERSIAQRPSLGNRIAANTKE